MQYCQASQSIANGTATTVLFNSEVFDTDSAYTTSTGKFQPQTAGKYYLYTVLRNDGATYEVNTRITKNGSDVVGDNITDNTGSESSVTFTTVDLNGSSDYVIVTVYQSSGGAVLDIVGSATDRTYFGGYKILT